MKRRGFFGIIAALGAAKAQPNVLEFANGAQMAVGGAGEPYRGTVAPNFTPAQEEALGMLCDSPAKYILFSGPRACGKTHVCRMAQPPYAETLIVVPDWRRADEFKEYGLGDNTHVVPGLWTALAGIRRDWFRIVVDDAHYLSPDVLSYICLLRAEDGKVLFTGMPYGEGYRFLRKQFPEIGWNGDERYRVHATSMHPVFLNATSQETSAT